MGRSTVHYADNKTNNALKRLHNKLRPAGTPVQRVEYIIELLLLRIFETKIKQDEEFKPLRKLFSPGFEWLNPLTGQKEINENRLFSHLPTVTNDQILSELNNNFFPFYANILQSARSVFEGNLPQKVQDQLVLIEEVFSNSNFTNNVNSGNLGEVISIVANDIEEVRLLKTDLLGDAIESALSETGGTKDIGLFRTPDHIRQFMTALVEPSFEDVIFDPACGTGGFLFDAFEFVMRRIDPENTWPGEKAHSELQEWFDNYFSNNKISFPSFEQSTNFYRTGVAGIEYLGMIRKMAAINFYVRGLNPANIAQGDSLQKYNSSYDSGSKSIILANPPFGAERDQEAYPNIWPEYAKESETTILFVKLMFELLKPGGKCAVVVSEGFHTWEQFSAKALRKMLLDEAQLKAVISLPQGVFVSKGGQGPKTSILLFEKGGKTEKVWFYKVTNDGYTTGSNRKEKSGNQLVECLSLYHKYIKHGIEPPLENGLSKHHFFIPAEWIKILDPRIKVRIRKETRAEFGEKGVKEQEKKLKDIDKKLKAGKLTEAEKQQEIKLFEQMLESRIQNEIAKRIDKAHTFSFNLASYRSTISKEHLLKWNEIFAGVPLNGATGLDEKYKKLKSASDRDSVVYLANLDPQNAVEFDIAREHLSSSSNLEGTLLKLQELIAKEAKYPTTTIAETCFFEKGAFPTQATPSGDYPLVVTAEERRTAPEYQFDAMAVCIPLISSTGHGSATLKRIHYQEGKFALANLLFAAIPKDPENQLLPKYLYYILDHKREELFCSLMKGSANVSMKMEDAVNVRFPLPTFEVQTNAIAKIEKQKAIIEGAEKVLNNWSVEINVDVSHCQKVLLNDRSYFKIIGGGTPDKAVPSFWNGDVPWISPKDMKSFYISASEDKVSNEAISGSATNLIPEKSVLVVVRSGILKHTLPVGINNIPVAINQDIKAIVAHKDFDPVYVGLVIKSSQLSILKKVRNGPTVEGIDLNTLGSIEIPKLSLEEQKKLVSNMNEGIEVLDGLTKMRQQAQNKIDQTLAEIWGEVI